MSGRKAQPVRESGIVVASFGRQYQVEAVAGDIVACVTRGRRGEIACGDRVDFALTGPGQGVIEGVEPRVSLFYRSDVQREKLIAANVTQIVIVLAAPDFHRELLDRCLAAAEHAAIRALIVLNKMDLASGAATLDSLALYRDLGYPTLPLAAKIDLAPLVAQLAGRTSVLVGQSGVGKSTIINRLVPAAAARVGALSSALGAGRHTTTSARLYHRDAACDIIDSPGLQEFGLHHLVPADLEHAFIEFRPYIGLCRFNDCRHVHEPGCAISAAAAAAQIHPQRVMSYRKLVTQLMHKARHWE